MGKVALAGLWVALMLFPALSVAEKPNVIRYHTAEWKGLTNKDGTGLYHEIVRTIFARHGIEVEVTYFPFRRTLLNLRAGEADIAGASGSQELDVLHSRNPIWATRVSALFHKMWSKDWEGSKTIEGDGSASVAPPGFSGITGLNLYEVSTRDQALNMVLERRMTYYVDEHETLNRLKAGHADVMGFEGWKPPTGINRIEWDLYVIKDVVDVPIFMLFQDNPQGLYFRDVFDEEFAKLHRSGELAALYEKWGLLDKMPRKLVD